MPRPDTRWIRGPALSLGSQAVGVTQLGVLLWRSGATNATDVYFYLFNVGMLPIQILIVGVLYPMMVSDERISQVHARRLMRTVPMLSGASVLVGASWLGAVGRIPDALLPIVFLAAVNAAVQAALWQRAIAASAAGHPEWEAAVALPANIVATGVLLFPWPSSTAAVTAMMSALVAGNSLFLVAAAKKRAGISAVQALPAQGRFRRSTAGWFGAKSGVGYGGFLLLQSLAVFLPTSALTLLSLAVKVVGSVSATLINAVMPRLVHQETSSPTDGRRFLRGTSLVVGPFTVLGVVGVIIVEPDYTLSAIALGLWLLASTTATAAQRLAFRFLPANASRVTLLSVPVVLTCAVGSARLQSFELVTLLCAYAAVDALVGALLLTRLRDRPTAYLAWAVATALGLVWMASLR